MNQILRKNNCLEESEEIAPIWFSHKEYKYHHTVKFTKRIFYWTKKLQTWNWSNCTVSYAKILDERIRISIRSSKKVYSGYRKKCVKLRYFFDFYIETNTTINAPLEESYKEPIDNLKEQFGEPKPRWVIKFDENRELWQWAEGEKSISQIQKVYDELIKIQKKLHIDNPQIFNVKTDDYEGMLPVVYQPVIDTWQNFVRDVYYYKIDVNEYEITILFNNEQLRKHAILDIPYRLIRLLIYRRVTDMESFRIIFDNDIPTKFRFKGIYSNRKNIQDDSIHGDRSWCGKKVPLHKIEYYFVNHNHPIVFVNTSNHAMAQFDTNSRLWKFEYIPWEKDSPISYGEKPRNKVDRFSWK